MKINKTNTKEKSPDGLTIPDQNTIIIKIIC